MVTHTQERIKKLLAKGLACASIAKKIGRPGDLERVHSVGCNCPETKEVPAGDRGDQNGEVR